MQLIQVKNKIIITTSRNRYCIFANYEGLKVIKHYGVMNCVHCRETALTSQFAEPLSSSIHFFRHRKEEFCILDFNIDKKKTRKDWDNLKNLLYWLGSEWKGGQQWARQIYKEFRRKYNDGKFKTWKEALNPRIREWAERKLQRAIEEINDPYVDNTRVACMKKNSQMRRYKKQKESGCCGYFDRKYIGPDGKNYLIGFNYGH